MRFMCYLNTSWELENYLNKPWSNNKNLEQQKLQGHNSTSKAKKLYILITRPKNMFWVQERIISVKQDLDNKKNHLVLIKKNMFFLSPTTYFGKKDNSSFTDFHEVMINM